MVADPRDGLEVDQPLGIGRVQEARHAYQLRLVVGGNLGRVDGQLVGQVLESLGDVMEHAVSIRENFPRPAGRAPVKVLLGSDVATPDAAHVRGVLCQFTCPVAAPGGTGGGPIL
jgi:hypothetical protein